MGHEYIQIEREEELSASWEMPQQCDPPGPAPPVRFIKEEGFKPAEPGGAGLFEGFVEHLKQSSTDLLRIRVKMSDSFFLIFCLWRGCHTSCSQILRAGGGRRVGLRAEQVVV